MREINNKILKAKMISKTKIWMIWLRMNDNELNINLDYKNIDSC